MTRIILLVSKFNNVIYIDTLLSIHHAITFDNQPVGYHLSEFFFQNRPMIFECRCNKVRSCFGQINGAIVNLFHLHAQILHVYVKLQMGKFTHVCKSKIAKHLYEFFKGVYLFFFNREVSQYSVFCWHILTEDGHLALRRRQRSQTRLTWALFGIRHIHWTTVALTSSDPETLPFLTNVDRANVAGSEKIQTNWKVDGDAYINE